VRVNRVPAPSARSSMRSRSVPQVNRQEIYEAERVGRLAVLPGASTIRAGRGRGVSAGAPQCDPGEGLGPSGRGGVLLAVPRD
jgi:hypothetical protein